MRIGYRVIVVALTAGVAFCFGAAMDTASAQKKPAAGKHQACVAKAQAENPGRGDGRQRQAAFNRCMGR